MPLLLVVLLWAEAADEHSFFCHLNVCLTMVKPSASTCVRCHLTKPQLEPPPSLSGRVLDVDTNSQRLAALAATRPARRRRATASASCMQCMQWQQASTQGQRQCWRRCIMAACPPALLIPVRTTWHSCMSGPADGLLPAHCCAVQQQHVLLLCHMWHACVSRWQ